MSELMNNIKKLREITGAGFLDCKKALEENENNIDLSVDFLRTKGLAKANKKSSREAKEGAAGIYSNQNLTSIILINTETDFAAKNDIFLNFMDEIGNFLISNNDPTMTVETFNEMKFNDRLISDHFKDLIAKIGENIILSKILNMKKNENSVISTYIHNPYRKNIGKIAVTLNIKTDKVDNKDLLLLGKNLCMHIAASKPLALNVESLDQDLIQKEKTVQLDTIKSSGKPDNIVEKILDGKMKKYFAESVLLNQEYILDNDKNIDQIIKDFPNDIEILEYNMIVLES